MTRRLLLLTAAVWLMAAAVAGAQTPAPSIEYYETDALGNIRVVTNHVGSEIRRHEILPFGEEWTEDASLTPDVRLFTGKERDYETGLDYFGARYYRAEIGRFTTIDPALNVKGSLTDPQKWNRYAYVLNNPLKFVDRDGREEDWSWLFRDQIRDLWGDAAVARSDRSRAALGGGVLLGLAGGAGAATWGAKAVGGAYSLLSGCYYSAGCQQTVLDLLAPEGTTVQRGGQWVSAGESMSARAAAFQVAAGGRAGQAYLLNGVKFDGMAKGTLLEMKGPGYATFVKNGQFMPWFKGAGSLVDQAIRQLAAARGTRIQWRFAEAEAAAATRALFQKAGIQGIEIVTVK